MFKFFNDIKYIFNKKEIFKLYLIFFFLLLVIFLDAISFTAIIPVANIIFFEKPLNFFFFKINYTIGLDNKFLILSIFIIIFIFKNLIIIFFNFYLVDFFKKINNRVSSRVFSSFLNQLY